MSFSVLRIVERESVPDCVVRISVVALQNGNCIVEFSRVNIQKRRNAWRVVRRVMLILSFAEAELERKAAFQSLKNRVGLIPVRNNRLRSELAHCRINDEARVASDELFVKCLCPDDFASVLFFFHEDSVSASCASSHRPVCDHGILSVLRLSDYDSASRIFILCQKLCE